MGKLRKAFEFPNPVNEYAARITAGLVVILAAATLLTGWGWGLAVIAAGFWLRVLFGPRISPLALLSVKVLAPRTGPGKACPRSAEALRAGHGCGHVNSPPRCCSRRGWPPPPGFSWPCWCWQPRWKHLPASAWAA